MRSIKTDVIERAKRRKGMGITLKTERMIIREHRADDIAAVEAYSTQEKFWRYLQVGELGEGSGRAYVERVIAEQSIRPRSEFNLALTLKAHEKIVGNVRLGITDLENGEGILGYAVVPEYWGQGYASEAVKAITDFAFNTLFMHRVYAVVDIENLASISVLQKCRFIQEGTLRENKISQGVRRSSHIYSLLTDEYSV